MTKHHDTSKPLNPYAPALAWIKKLTPPGTQKPKPKAKPKRK